MPDEWWKDLTHTSCDKGICKNETEKHLCYKPEALIILLEEHKRRICKDIEEMKYKKATPMTAHDISWDMALDAVLNHECLKKEV